MINKDRIVPITRTDLLSFFAALMNASGRDSIFVLQVEDGTVTIPDTPSGGVYVAAEPLKALPEVAGNVQLYFVPAYDFETTMTPMDGAPEFVADPGNLYMATNSFVVQLDTLAKYTAA